MKILLIDPGAGTSTADVFNGLVPALKRQGHEVFGYPLSARIDLRMSWLDYLYRRRKKTDANVTRPTYADGLRLAAERALPIALREGADWVVVVSGMFFPKEQIYLLRRAGLRVALLLTESPYDDADQAQVAPLANVVWTNERVSVPFLKLVNPNTHYLPHAFDPATHYPAADDDSDDTRAHDVVFVGTNFRERLALLSAVNWDGIDLGLYGNWRSLPSRDPLRRFVYGGPTPNAKTAALYRRAKIGLNLYRTSKGHGGNSGHILAADSLNPRALELAACGVFHLSDRRPEVEEVFGDLVPTFATSQELDGQLRGWLARPAERRALAAQLPGAVADRTFDRMALTVTADLERTMAAEQTRQAVAA